MLTGAVSALADPAITVAPATMHRTPNFHSRIVQHVPANAQIDLEGCTGGWCYASWRDLFGYIRAEALAGDAPPVAVAPPVVVAPTWGWGGPYVGFGWGYGWRRW